MIKVKKIFSNSISFVFTLLFGIFLVLHPRESINGVTSGIRMCLNTLVPALFPFIFFSCIMVNSGIFQILGKLLSPVSKFLFFLPPSSSSVILLSMIGGFPVGARGIKDLFERNEINSEQAERMLLFCVNAGPAFILGVIGNSLIKNLEIASIILVSQILSSVIIASILGILAKVKIGKIYSSNNKVQKENFTESIIKSCESSSMSIIQMCTLVIIFNIFSIFLDNLQILSYCSRVLSYLKFPGEISDCFPQIIMEVTKSCKMISSYGVFPSLLSFATSWGGLCVHFQVFSIMKNLKINYLKFFAFRFLNACLSSFLTFILIKIQNISFDFRKIEVPQTSTHVFGSVALVVFCLIFLLDLKLKKKFN